jgi:glucose/arabinose dehydrogenase
MTAHYRPGSKTPIAFLRRRLPLLLLTAAVLLVARPAASLLGPLIGRATGPLAVRALPPERTEITTSVGVRLQVETLARDLDTPWDLAWGPDSMIWFTERGGRVSRLDLASGRVTPAGEIAVAESGESGLMGMAFHPDFPRQPWIYFAHSYSSGGIRNRLIRMSWRAGRLQNPETLLENIPGRGNHDGSRLAIGPDRLLYMTMGDAGDAENAQDQNSLSGKILRLTLDGRPAPGNPFDNATWSWGHRNPQGLAFMTATGMLYSSEHGPGDADEVNVVLKGRNYGWPAVHGACDTDAERNFCRQHDVVEPITEYTPTIGISGLAVYESDRIPGWRGSLLVTSLRGARFLHITLTPDGRRAASQEDLLRGEYGRLRDVLVTPDGAIYIATSNKDGRGSPAPQDDRILRIRPRA